MEIKARPVLDRVLILQDEAKSEIAGFIIPESEKVKPKRGTVVAIGWGRELNDGSIVPLTVKVGDKVQYSEFETTEAEVDGVVYQLIREGNLHLIL